ncbi:MAG: DUF3108 domain-containing protein [Gammaproteobacteria bacterium]|nr:DUF3108 domain-containing protein [Gammaproteobacteria bacterium]
MNGLAHRRASAVLFTTVLCSLCSYSFPQGAALLEYTAEYDASANGLAATASRSLVRIDENSYRLSNSLEASLAGQTLAKLEQASEFILEDNQIVSQNYSYQLSGIASASHAIFFNWDAKIALSTEDGESWPLAINDGVMDQLSSQAAMRQNLIDARDGASTFSFEIIDGDTIETQQYRIAGEEILSTPLGLLNTLRLERVREASDERVTKIWLAVDWNYLLTRIEQLNNSGLRIVLELKSAELNGEIVRANK